MNPPAPALPGPFEPAPLLLLPPSEGKAPAGSGAPWSAAPHRFPSLDAARREALAALVDRLRSPGDPGRLLGCSGPLLSEVLAANLAAGAAPTLPALQRYTGVVHAALDVLSLPEEVQVRAGRDVLVPSGLWGLLAGSDPVPAYRLKMSASLPGLGRLSSWWRPRLSPLLASVAPGRLVLDLLPGEHAAALDPSSLEGAVHVRVRFERERSRDGRATRSVVGHDAKRSKGLLARHALLGGPGLTVEHLAAFEAGGYVLDEPASSLDGSPLLVFVQR